MRSLPLFVSIESFHEAKFLEIFFPSLLFGIPQSNTFTVITVSAFVAGRRTPTVGKNKQASRGNKFRKARSGHQAIYEI